MAQLWHANNAKTIDHTDGYFVGLVGYFGWLGWFGCIGGWLVGLEVLHYYMRDVFVITGVLVQHREVTSTTSKNRHLSHASVCF
jgi:hypothetical protein